MVESESLARVDVSRSRSFVRPTARSRGVTDKAQNPLTACLRTRVGRTRPSGPRREPCATASRGCGDEARALHVPPRDQCEGGGGHARGGGGGPATAARGAGAP